MNATYIRNTEQTTEQGIAGMVVKSVHSAADSGPGMVVAYIFDGETTEPYVVHEDDIIDH
jgi:hypothetical protein